MVTEFRGVLSTKAFLKKEFLDYRYKNCTHLKIEGNRKRELRGTASLWQVKQHRPRKDILAGRPLSARGTVCSGQCPAPVAFCNHEDNKADAKERQSITFPDSLNIGARITPLPPPIQTFIAVPLSDQ